MKSGIFTLSSHLIGLSLLLAISIQPVSADDANDELTALLKSFLAGASVNDAAAHDRFWAEDLIYTSSSGDRFGKAEIMEGLAESDSSGNDEPTTVYSAEAIRIQQYGDTAVVAFRLVGTATSEPEDRTEYLNTGTFLKRDNEWRVVAWQATRVPEKDDN